MQNKKLLYQLEQVTGQLPAIGPELLLTAGLILLIIIELATRGRRRALLQGFSLVLSAGVLGLVAVQWGQQALPAHIFFDQLIVDKAALFSKAIILPALIFTLLFSSGRWLRTEYYCILLALALGAMFMTGSASLLSAYVSIELTSISGYILTVFGFKKLNYEAGIKYLLFGAFASGLMLYGMSLLYGITGTLDISEGLATGLAGASQPPTMLAVLLMMTGIFFKTALFPMHLWVPDVYQTAPVPVAAIFSVVPKVGALLILYRLAPALLQVEHFREVLLTLAVISITYGNIAALKQTNVRRMLGYSSIAQAGFLVIPLAIYDVYANTSFYFYVFIYLFMNYLAFYLVDHLEREQKFSFADYHGLGTSKPLIGLFFLVAMVSLAGLPPLAGFTAKLYIFSSLWNEWQASFSNSVLFVLLLAAANTVIALFYYLKIPWVMFIKARGVGHSGELTSLNTSQTAIAGIFTITLVLLFIRPDTIINFIKQIMSQ